MGEISRQKWQFLANLANMHQMKEHNHNEVKNHIKIQYSLKAVLLIDMKHCLLQLIQKKILRRSYLCAINSVAKSLMTHLYCQLLNKQTHFFENKGILCTFTHTCYCAMCKLNWNIHLTCKYPLFCFLPTVDRFAKALSLHPCRTVPDFGWSQHPSFHCLVQSHSGFRTQAILYISERRMVKYFCNSTDIRSTWDHVVSAFWQRYPNPFRSVFYHRFI